MSFPIPILYQDKDFIVFDKPSGLLVVPDPAGVARTMEDIVNQQCPVTEQGPLYPCHRLDRETSGVIIFAHGKANQERMMDEFRKGAVYKKYIAFVRGKMKNSAGEIKSVIRDFHDRARNVRGSADPIRGEAGRAPRSDVRGSADPIRGEAGRAPRSDVRGSAGRSASRRKSEGKFALTRYKVVTVKHLFTVVEVFPLTGRTNQIRIHLGEVGHPILGERLYARGKDFPVKFKRVALHASEVGFVHPLTGKKISVSAELAKDMEIFLNRY